MNCHDVETRDLVAEYAHGRLSETDRDAFEEHLLGCEACFDELQTYRLVRNELASNRPKAAPAWRRASVLGGLAVAAALALAIVSTLLSRPASPAPQGESAREVPAAPPTTPETPALPTGPSRAELVMQLARVEPPAYLPPSLRGAEDDARRRFAAAMERYQARDFAAAADGLRALADRDNATAEAVFYLAISELSLGRLDRAASGLERVLAKKDFLFEEDAHFFLGKVRLAQDDTAAARREFQQVIDLKGDREQEARSLVAAIDQLPSR